MKRITSIIEFIQTKEFAFVALTFSLIPQVIHSYDSFYSLSRIVVETPIDQIKLIAGGVFFSLGVSAAILILTIAGWTRLAIGALAVEFFINLVYYKIWVQDDIVLHILRSIYALIMPMAIALYSHVMEFFIVKEKEEVKSIHVNIDELKQTVDKRLNNLTNQLLKEKNIQDIAKSYIETTNFTLMTETGKQVVVNLKENDTRDTQED